MLSLNQTSKFATVFICTCLIRKLTHIVMITRLKIRKNEKSCYSGKRECLFLTQFRTILCKWYQLNLRNLIFHMIIKLYDPTTGMYIYKRYNFD